MKVALALALAAALSTECGASAQPDEDALKACLNVAMTQSAMNECASDHLARADALLNQIYRHLLALVKDDKRALAKVKEMERAWVSYRDLALEAAFPEPNKQIEYGSMYPMEADLMQAELTYRQVESLKDLVEQYTPK